MKGRHRRRRQEGAHTGNASAGRVFVVRRTALGYRVFVRHPYGRVTRLAAPPVSSLGAPASDVRADFADLGGIARAVAKEALRRSPAAAEATQVASLISGPGPRWEPHEDSVRAAAARAARAAA